MSNDASWLDFAGRLLIVISFVVAGAYNLTPAAIKQHIGRLAGFRVPLPTAAFWIGIAIQFTGCALVLAGWHADLGALLLIGFTIAATGIYHRFWTKPDVAQRIASRLTVVSNTAIVGGLLLLLDNFR